MNEDRREPDGLTRPFALNLASTLLVYVVYLAATFAVNKVLVVMLGAVAFGAWQVCLRLLSFVTPGDGPVSQALRWLVANRHRTEDGAGLRRLVGSAFVLWGVLAGVMALVGAVLCWLAPGLVRDLPPELAGAVRVACGVLILRMIVASAGKLYLAPVQGLNITYRLTAAEVGLELLRGSSLVGAAWLGLGLGGLAGGLTLAALVSVLVYRAMVRRLVEWFGVARPQRADFAAFSRFGGWLLASNVMYRVLMMSDIVLMGWAVGATAVSRLTFTQQIGNFGVYVVVLVAGAFAPGLGRLVGTGELDRARAARREMLAAAWLLVVTVAAGVLVWNRSFVTLWVGEDLYGGTLVNFLVVVLFVQTAFLRLDGMIIDAALELRGKVLVSGASAVLTLAAALVLGRRWGMPGVLAGLVAGRALVTVAYPLLASRVLRGGGETEAGNLPRLLLVTVLLLGGAGYLGARLPAVGVGPFLGGTVLTGCLTAFLAFRCGFDGPRRARFLTRLAALRRRDDPRG